MQKITLAEEKILVEKAKESLSAFSKLYEYYLPKIYSYLLNRVGDKKTAEDITPTALVIHNAEGKALEIAQKHKNS